MDEAATGTSSTHCRECGTELASATVDFEPKPDVSDSVDQQRAMFHAGEMTEVLYCPNPDCPLHREAQEGDDSGAQV